MKIRTIIIGGGLAGLAAAVRLALEQVPVLLLEARASLGGRAGSYRDPQSGWVIDNCQHVSMGCCTELRWFCEATGNDQETSFRTERELYFIDGPGRISCFRAWPLPAPLHLAPAFAGLKYLSWSDKWQIARAMRSLISVPNPPGPHDQPDHFPDESCLAWLQRHHQSDRLIEQFWGILFVSALSESLDRIDIRHARKVVVAGFLKDRHGWEVQIPNQPLSELYGNNLSQWLISRGVEIRCSAPVSQFVMEESGERIQSVRLNSGDVVEGDNFLSAVTVDRLKSLLPTSLTVRDEWRFLDQIETAPITSVHLWFDRAVSKLPHAVFIGRTSQWMFRRPLDENRPPELENSPAGQTVGDYAQIVISASRVARAMEQPELIAAVCQDLRECFPEAGAAKLLHARVITETRAVFSPVPGIDRIRPSQQSAVPNLQLAGDWTRTGWPSTMESAVRSGRLAAENILERG